MHHETGIGKIPHHGPRAAGMVKVDMGRNDEIDVFKWNPFGV
jgi:hypothetical protein